MSNYHETLFPSRTALQRCMIDVFMERDSANCELEQRGGGSLVIRTSGGAPHKSKAERYHGDLRFRDHERG